MPPAIRSAPHKIHFERLGKKGPVLEVRARPDADCILFYPGTMLEPGHYSLFLNSLANAGLTVAAIHLAGHGRAKGGGFSFQSLLDQGLLAEQWLRSQAFSKIAVCGHSQGGIFTVAHAASSTSLAAAFAITAVFPRMECAINLTRFAPLARYRNKLLGALRHASSIAPRLPVPLPFYLELRKILKGKVRPICMGAGKGRISYPLEFLASLFDAKIPDRVNCPFRLFSAKNDALFTPGLTETVFRKITAPDKRLIWLENGGHMAILNPYFADFMARKIVCVCAGLGFGLNLPSRT